MTTIATRLAWICSTCQNECIPIRSESRCLCGHRHKEHNAGAGWRCKAGCPCHGFFYIVAEGAWVLRCRCKHKHVEHDPATPTHGCTRTGCACTAFDSPWVCNCDHPWAEHRQVEADARAQRAAAPGAEVNRWDLLRRGNGSGAAGTSGGGAASTTHGKGSSTSTTDPA